MAKHGKGIPNGLSKSVLQASYSTTPASLLALQTLWARLERADVVLPDRVQAESFLMYHDDMFDVVGGLCEAARREFARPDELCLEVYVDPEEGQTTLTIYLRQWEYSDDIMDRIGRVRSEFYDDLARISGWLHLTTDFSSPQEIVERVSS